MEKNIRLNNSTTFDIGIITPEFPHGLNIRPKSFTMVSEDDVAFLMSTTTLLEKGWLQIAQEEKKQEVLAQMGIDPKETAAFMSEEEIRKKLKANTATLRKWIEGITDRMALHTVGEIAKDMNLNHDKVKILQEKITDVEF